MNTPKKGRKALPAHVYTTCHEILYKIEFENTPRKKIKKVFTPKVVSQGTWDHQEAILESAVGSRVCGGDGNMAMWLALPLR